MKKKLLFFYLCSLSSCLLGQTLKSDIINSSGETLSSGNVSITYSIGEVSVSEYPGRLSEGLLGAYSSFLTATEREVMPSLNFFPNPVNDYLTVISPSTASAFIRIYDSLGRLATPHTIDGNRIDLSAIRPGVYHIIISDRFHKNLHSFKIIKN